MAASQSKLARTAQAVIDGYNSWNIDSILAPRAPNCTQQVIPSSLNRPVLNNEQYREYFSRVMPSFQNFKVQVLNAIVDEKQSKVCIHAKSTAETGLGDYANEYSIFMTMTADHEQVVEILEFVDSKYSDDFFAKLRAHNDGHGKTA